MTTATADPDTQQDLPVMTDRQLVQIILAAIWLHRGRMLWRGPQLHGDPDYGFDRACVLLKESLSDRYTMDFHLFVSPELGSARIHCELDHLIATGRLVPLTTFPGRFSLKLDSTTAKQWVKEVAPEAPVALMLQAAAAWNQRHNCQ